MILGKRKHNAMKEIRMRLFQKGLVREPRGGEIYEYYPLGKYVVSAPGICSGRPTFKYTRIRVEFVLDLIAAGWSIEEVTRKYQTRLSHQAVREAIQLAKKAFIKTLPTLRLAA